MSQLVFLNLGFSKTDNVLQLIGLIILCVLIIAASYYTTKFVGKRQMGARKGGNFTVIDTMRLDAHKYLQLVKMGEKYIVIAVGKDTVTFITELSPQEIIKRGNGDGAGKSFKDVLTSVARKHTAADAVETAEKTAKETEEETCGEIAEDNDEEG